MGRDQLLPARMDAAEAIRRTSSGKPMQFEEAVAAGLFDRVAPDSGKLIATAMQWLAEQKQGARERDGAPRKWIGRPACAAGVLSAVGEVKEECSATEPGAAVCKAVEVGSARGGMRRSRSSVRNL
jgi:enoyl-CoA hydratase/carnithine racemase